MTLTLPEPLAAALATHARQRGVAPEEVVVHILGQRLLPLTPIDEWERGLFAAAIDCGVSIPDSALSSDGLYD